MDVASNFQDRHVKIPDLTKAAKVLKNPVFAVEKELCSLKWDGLDDITLQRFGSFHFQISSMDTRQNLQIWKTIYCLLNSNCFLATSYPLAWNQSYQLFSSLFCATLPCICFSSASWVLVPLVPGRNMVVSEKWPALMGNGSLDLTHQRILMSCRRDGGDGGSPQMRNVDL